MVSILSLKRNRREGASVLMNEDQGEIPKVYKRMIAAVADSSREKHQ